MLRLAFFFGTNLLLIASLFGEASSAETKGTSALAARASSRVDANRMVLVASVSGDARFLDHNTATRLKAIAALAAHL